MKIREYTRCAVAVPATFPRRLDQKSQLPQLSQAPPQKTEFPEASRGASARLAPREEEQSEAPPPNSANSANFPSAWEQKSQLACDSLRLFENRGCAGASRADPLRAEYRRVLDAGPLFDMPLQRWTSSSLMLSRSSVTGRARLSPSAGASTTSSATAPAHPGAASTSSASFGCSAAIASSRWTTAPHISSTREVPGTPVTERRRARQVEFPPPPIPCRIRCDEPSAAKRKFQGVGQIPARASF